MEYNIIKRNGYGSNFNILYINNDKTLINYQYEYTIDNLLYFINTNL